VPPDTAAGLSYPPGAKFTHHFDTRHLYREARGDVSLGVASAVYFHASETALRTQHVAHNGGHNKQVVVALPPRSIYCMAGDARYKWKHGIQPTPCAIFRWSRGICPV
jgi:alkylated DNA repair dioxygenase AlkB